MTVQTVQKLQKATVKTVMVSLQIAFLLGVFTVLILIVAAGVAFSA